MLAQLLTLTRCLRTGGTLVGTSYWLWVSSFIGSELDFLFAPSQNQSLWDGFMLIKLTEDQGINENATPSIYSEDYSNK